LEASVLETPIGLFVVDNKDNVIEKHLFSAREAARELNRVREGELPSEFLAGLKRAAQSYSPLIFETTSLANAAKQGGVSGEVKSSSAVEQFRNRLSSDWDGREKWLSEQGIRSPSTETASAYNEFTRQVTLQIARVGIAVAATRRDLSSVQAVRGMDDLDKTLNLLAGRVREWYGLHFPEMDHIVEKHDTYVRLVAKLCNRKNFTVPALVEEGLSKEMSEQLASAAKRSMGGEIDDADLTVLQSFCSMMLDLYKFRGRTESYVEQALKQVAPNMTAIVGAPLAARLISIAGSLNNLAKMPASTVQVLGAEKALFRSLKTGARPPKHGVIFQHAAIHQAPRWQRGKIARTLSGKLTIAARVDAFGGDFVGEELKRDVDKKIDGIKERYKVAPPPAPPPVREQQKKRSFGRTRKTR
jgi:nucleolar protein 56